MVACPAEAIKGKIKDFLHNGVHNENYENNDDNNSSNIIYYYNTFSPQTRKNEHK
jgi:hypothetical protein